VPRLGHFLDAAQVAHAAAAVRDRVGEEDLVVSDVGIDGGGATAEEAAVHVVEEDDYDIRSE